MKNWLKELLKNLGILIIISGVIYMTYTIQTSTQTNITLMISGGLIAIGFTLYLMLNKLIN